MSAVNEILEYVATPDDFDPANPPPGELGRRLMLRWRNWEAAQPLLEGFDPHVRPGPGEESTAAVYVIAALGFDPALLLRYGDGNARDFLYALRILYDIGTPADLVTWRNDLGQYLLDVLVLGFDHAEFPW